MTYTSPRRWVVTRHLRLAAVALVLMSGSACTAGGDDADSGSSNDEAAAEAGDTVAGCEEGWTDPADLSPDRAPARCESGAPAPDPLDERKTIVVTSSTLSAEFIAVLRYGIDKGEFDKENIDVELRPIPPAEAYPLVGAGEVDATWSAPDAAFVNAVAAGFDLRWALGNFSVPEESQTGLWVAAESGEPIDLASLAGTPIGNIVGKGSSTAYPIAEALADEDLSLGDVEFQTLPAADLVTALQNGSLKAAWVLDPLWTQLVDDPSVAFVKGQPLGEPLGGLVVGPSLLRDDPDAGVAFVRAYIRTLNTYFAGDYKDDEALLDDVARVLELPAEQLAATPSPVWDWEIRGGTTDRLQEAYLDGEVLETNEPLTEDDLVDRSLYEAAVGHAGT